MSNEGFATSTGGAVGDASALVNSATCSSSRWLTEEVFKLIDMVQSDEAIYNPRHKYYFCRPYVENFWREVDLKLEKNPGASLAKWTNLRISFRREYTNYLEEKVPPCWSYFDRMFFLHPYLRKKHQQSKIMDSHVQDALVHMTNFSTRFQRERAVAAATSAAVSMNVSESRSLHSQHQAPPQLDTYLDYLDDNSESDDLIDEDQQLRFRSIDSSSLTNEIKSECEDYDEIRNDDDVDEQDTNGRSVHNLVINSLASAATAALQDKRSSMRNQYLNRLSIRSYHDDEVRTKRPRSHDSIGSPQNSTHAQRVVCSSTPSHSNVSFVRPTFAKPIDVVSTTTSVNHSTQNANDTNVQSSSTTTTASASNVLPQTLAHQQHISHRHMSHHHHHRLEVAAGANATVASTPNAINSLSTSNHLELCDCKTDPDAMFLMSLLPDIQKLNGRDRGKIKIAFQNILQDYLYPD